MDRQQQPPGIPPVPMPPPGQTGVVNQAMGRFDPTQAEAAQRSPDLAAQRAYTDALQSKQGDPLVAAKEAWKAAAQREADPNTPDAPGSANLRKIQQHLVQTRGLDELTAWALAHETLPSLMKAQQGQGPTTGVP